MGTLFTFLTVRITLILIALTAASMMVIMVIVRSQPAFDSFMPYADILPGQSRENVLQRGFYCQLKNTFITRNLLIDSANRCIFRNTSEHRGQNRSGE